MGLRPADEVCGGRKGDARPALQAVQTLKRECFCKVMI